MSKRDNTTAQDSQQGSENGGAKQKLGDYTMVVSEILRALYDRRIIRLSSDEKSILLYLIHKTIGQHCELRQIKPTDFMKDTGIPRSIVFDALKTLTAKQLIKKEKQKGVRAYFYAVNKDYFERIYPKEIPNIYYMDKFRKSENPDSQSMDSTDFESRSSQTFKNSKNQTGKGHQSDSSGKQKNAPQIFPQIFPHISLNKDFRAFVEAKPRATRGRWERLIQEILSKSPGDHNFLLYAIERIDRTQKDLHGAQIRSSVIALFESTEWEIMKSTLMVILEKEKAEQEKRRRIEEQERMLRDAKAQIPDSQEVNLDNLSPLFRKYATMGQSS